MLDFSISELLLIAVVALVVIGPKDLPVVMRHLMKLIRELRALYMGLKKQMLDVMDEAGLNDLHKDMTTIIDLEGKPQKAYNVDDLKQLDSRALVPPSADTPVMRPLPPVEKP